MKTAQLDILICTIAQNISGIADMLLPARADVRYVVSVQHSGPESQVNIPQELSSRPDVTIGLLSGKGLSRNRNNALRMATGDICLIADDDNRYLPEHIDAILDSWKKNPDADILTFQAQDYEGAPLHPYPAPYICSVEITFRRSSILEKGLKFDERFGLGSQLLCAGEEDVFMADARRAGLNIRYIPQVIVRTNGTTTGIGLIDNPKLQITKGATFRYVYGTASAVWRSFKEAGWYMFHKGANPFPILSNMLKGIWILR
ncbi:MAG: glycosyltransferase family 2 protein [Bacteroidaceae bacterium]|nr:glycosyltransferase family 2 protein [Bacteroidaceae bacterium]